MSAFWVVALGMAVLVGASVLLVLLGRRTVSADRSADLSVYKDQLEAVDRDVARGTVSPDEADRLRLEIKRRLLEADKAARGEGEASGPPRTLTLVVAGLSGLVILGGSAYLYNRIGAPGYPDLPLEARIAAAAEAAANRPSQETAEASVPPIPTPEIDPGYADLMERLRAAVAERPGDIQGLRLLARNEASIGNHVAARIAQGQLIAALGDDATADDWADYTDILVLAAGGFVSPEAERAIEETLKRDPQNGTARYYAGLLNRQTGRPDLAFRFWEDLLRRSPPEAPWVPPIRAQIETVAMLAGEDYSLPPLSSAPGPTAEDVEAAGEMTPEDRMAMIEGMVSGLSDRLATEGGTPEEWARLIRALGVLGRREEAALIWEEAQRVFPDPVVQIPILQAARDAGVSM